MSSGLPGSGRGLLWLAYQQTAEPEFRRRAEALIPDFVDRLDAGGAGTDTHDLGFLYTMSCTTALRLTGGASRERELGR